VPQLSPFSVNQRAKASIFTANEDYRVRAVPLSMTSPRRTFTRDSLLRLRHCNSCTISRSVRRTLWWLRLLRPIDDNFKRSSRPLPSLLALSTPTPNRCRTAVNAINFSDPPGGAGDREAQQHRAPALLNHTLRFATLNCRTLKAPWRRGMAAQLASSLKVDVLMLQELSIVAGPGLQQEDLGDGWTLFFTSADSRGHGGVGVLLHHRLSRSVSCLPLTSRLMKMTLRLRRRNAHLFCVYGPTATHPDRAVEFYDLLSEHLEAVPQRDTLLILGDFNAVLRRCVRAPFASFAENANTDAFEKLIDQHDLISLNTTFRKPLSRLATFVGCKRRRRNATGPNATRRFAQLDHILIRSRERCRAVNCDSITPIVLRSDHKLLFCDLRLRDSLYRPPSRKPRRNFSALRDPNVAERFSRALKYSLGSDPEPHYHTLCDSVRQAARHSLPLLRSYQLSQPVWMNNPSVRNARLEIHRLRRRRQPTEEAEKALATVYLEQQRLAAAEAIRTVATAAPNRKSAAVWSAINAITGRKQRRTLNLPGDTPEERKRAARDFFAGVVNAPPPPLPDSLSLPENTPLPDSNSFTMRPVTTTEVIRLARMSPGGKATGPDEVPTEALRIHGVAHEVARIINNVLVGGEAPNEWTLAHVVPVPKMAGTSKIEEHRGISLMSCAAKIYNKLLLLRLQSVLDPFLRHEQNGFRPGRGTVTHILSLRRLIEESRRRQSNLVCVFVDFYKAFDSVTRAAIPLVLRAFNVPEQLVAAVMALYRDSKAAVVTPDGLTEVFCTTSGVLQGDSLAPFLFVLLLDWVLRTGLPSNNNGFQLCRRSSSRHPEKRLALLAYADDLVLLANSGDDAQRLVDGLARTAAKIGLRINTKKTEVFTIPSNLPVSLHIPASDSTAAIPLPSCQAFRYLGGQVPSIREDLRHRRRLAWAAFRSSRSMLQNDRLPDQLRGKLFKALVESVLLYNAETWTMTDSFEKVVDATHSNLLRATFRIHHEHNPASNKQLYDRARLLPPSVILRQRRLKLVGHILRSRDYRPEPLHDILLLSLRTPLRRGQGRTLTYLDRLLSDANAPDQRSGVTFLLRLAEKRVI
jgi:exonuclease III